MTFFKSPQGALTSLADHRVIIQIYDINVVGMVSKHCLVCGPEIRMISHIINLQLLRQQTGNISSICSFTNNTTNP